MIKVKSRLAMMCDLDSSYYDPRLVSEEYFPDDEAKEMEQFKNENGKVVMMGITVGDWQKYGGKPKINRN